ncbi:uncharacterized protein LOC117122568 [Anneissia japonica]|uniref:uncharacterized protein LOC117122568 n=1 Tax=Anneissia japonica TaxID=1529436 RepID=UPI0014255C43|nr:uncharacterized protein LOC117122568 [Anneissia japonica]
MVLLTVCQLVGLCAVAFSWPISKPSMSASPTDVFEKVPSPNIATGTDLKLKCFDSGGPSNVTVTHKNMIIENYNQVQNISNGCDFKLKCVYSGDLANIAVYRNNMIFKNYNITLDEKEGILELVFGQVTENSEGRYKVTIENQDFFDEFGFQLNVNNKSNNVECNGGTSMNILKFTTIPNPVQNISNGCDFKLKCVYSGDLANIAVYYNNMMIENYIKTLDEKEGILELVFGQVTENSEGRYKVTIENQDFFDDFKFQLNINDEPNNDPNFKIMCSTPNENKTGFSPGNISIPGEHYTNSGADKTIAYILIIIIIIGLSFAVAIIMCVFLIRKKKKKKLGKENSSGEQSEIPDQDPKSGELRSCLETPEQDPKLDEPGSCSETPEQDPNSFELGSCSETPEQDPKSVNLDLQKHLNKIQNQMNLDFV